MSNSNDTLGVTGIYNFSKTYHCRATQRHTLLLCMISKKGTSNSNATSCFIGMFDISKTYHHSATQRQNYRYVLCINNKSERQTATLRQVLPVFLTRVKLTILPVSTISKGHAKQQQKGRVLLVCKCESYGEPNSNIALSFNNIYNINQQVYNVRFYWYMYIMK